jgi:hypothetical protein
LFWIASRRIKPVGHQSNRLPSEALSSDTARMIRKSVKRFSEKIMPKQEAQARGLFNLIPSAFSGDGYAHGDRKHRETLGGLCHRYGVLRLEVFGSAARGADFDPAESDEDKIDSGVGLWEECSRNA